jgi:hypothetical protein
MKRKIGLRHTTVSFFFPFFSRRRFRVNVKEKLNFLLSRTRRRREKKTFFIPSSQFESSPCMCQFSENFLPVEKKTKLRQKKEKKLKSFDKSKTD